MTAEFISAKATQAISRVNTSFCKSNLHYFTFKNAKAHNETSEQQEFSFIHNKIRSKLLIFLYFQERSYVRKDSAYSRCHSNSRYTVTG